MIIVLSFVFGFLLCFACCWRRLVELRRAFLAVVAENETMRRREAEALAAQIAAQREVRRLNKQIELGAPALLPPAAVAVRAARNTLAYPTCSGHSREWPVF